MTNLIIILKNGGIMKSKTILFVILFLILNISLFSAGQNDDEINIAKSMRDIMGVVRKINQNLDSENYFGTAQEFMALASIFKSLTTIEPPKGSKDQWDKINNGIVKESFLAIGAAADEDKQSIKAHLDRIFELQKEGHSLYR